MKSTYRLITPKSRADLRNWLKKHHTEHESVWVVIYKVSSGKVNLSANDVVEESLCFGWIDSVPGKIDAEKYKLLISPRRPKSVWSAVNKLKVSKLIQTKRMTVHGLEKITRAKRDGSWNRLNASDRMVIPPALKRALQKNKKAQKFFEAMAPSSRRAILEWIYAAKTQETKSKRIAQTVQLAARRIRAHHPADLKPSSRSRTGSK